MSVGLSLKINDEECRATVAERMTLADFLRDDRGLTGTHLGCEQGVCGACTVLVDGRAVRSCLILAAQANGARVTTIEGLADDDGRLHPLQRAFADHDALQCGFCTPGLLMTCVGLLDGPALDEDALRSALSGNLCRCTGYSGIVAAFLDVQAERQGVAPLPVPVDSHPPAWATWQPGRAAARSLDRRLLVAATIAVLVVAGGLWQRLATRRSHG